jgi:hypothetical protein
MSTTAQTERLSGYHSHICPGCGCKWVHGDQFAGDAKEHTCPGCGQTMPLTLQAPGTKVEGFPEGSKVWTKGWAKASVIMANGEERQVVQPKQSNDGDTAKAALMIFGIAVLAAVAVYFAMPHIRALFSDGGAE